MDIDLRITLEPGDRVVFETKGLSGEKRRNLASISHVHTPVIGRLPMVNLSNGCQSVPHSSDQPNGSYWWRLASSDLSERPVPEPEENETS